MHWKIFKLRNSKTLDFLEEMINSQKSGNKSRKHRERREKGSKNVSISVKCRSSFQIKELEN